MSTEEELTLENANETSKESSDILYDDAELSDITKSELESINDHEVQQLETTKESNDIIYDDNLGLPTAAEVMWRLRIVRITTAIIIATCVVNVILYCASVFWFQLLNCPVVMIPFLIEIFPSSIVAAHLSLNKTALQSPWRSAFIAFYFIVSCVYCSVLGFGLYFLRKYFTEYSGEISSDFQWLWNTIVFFIVVLVFWIAFKAITCILLLWYWYYHSNKCCALFFCEKKYETLQQIAENAPKFELADLDDSGEDDVAVKTNRGLPGTINSKGKMEERDNGAKDGITTTPKQEIVLKVITSLLVVAVLILVIMSLISLIYINISYDSVGDENACDPKNPSRCVLPFPSATFLVRDNSTETGYRVSLPKDLLTSVTRGLFKVDPTPWNSFDGFPISAPLLFYLSNNIDLSGSVNRTNIDSYEDISAKTVIIDVTSGNRIPHWVEFDRVDSRREITIIQPAVPLNNSRRYVVGIRNFADLNGNIISPSNAITTILKNNTLSGIPSETIARYHSDVFPHLMRDGWKLEEIQIAWDFVTVSRKSSLGLAKIVRDDAAQRWEQSSPQFYFTKREDFSCEHYNIARSIEGVLMVPSYLKNGRGTPLNTDESRTTVNFSGNYFPSQFLINIPCSVGQNPKPNSFILQYGHGLFDARNEINERFFKEMTNQFVWISFASDWLGLSRLDIFTLFRVIFNLQEFHVITDNLIQAFVNFDLTLKLMKHPSFIADSAFHFPNKENTTSVLGSDSLFAFAGNSLGGILGGGYVSFSQEINRALLGVTGTPLACLIPQSANVLKYQDYFSMFSWRHIRVIIGMFQMFLDSSESAGWLNEAREQIDSGKKQFLIHAAIGDPEVPTIGAEIQARGYGCNTVKPQTRPIYGIEEKEAPFYGSGIVEYRYLDVPEIPPLHSSRSANENPHECPRRQEEAQSQMQLFFASGRVVQTCEGVCEKPTCDG